MVLAGPYITVAAVYLSDLLCPSLVEIPLPGKSYYMLLGNHLPSELAATVNTDADGTRVTVCADIAFEPQGIFELHRAEVYTPPWLGCVLVVDCCLGKLLKGPPVVPPPTI